MKPRVIVLAKSPVAGQVKTRLCPPCTFEQAAALAEAALIDTLAAVAGVRGTERVLVLDGDPGPWLPTGFSVVAQRRGGLADRLAGACADVGDPALLVGMDTPQLTAGLVRDALDELARPDTDCVIGPAVDGGYWAIGLRAANAEVFHDVPMSTAETLGRQRERFHQLGLRVRDLPVLRDVDEIDDAYAVAEMAPTSRFAAVCATLDFTRERTPVCG